MLPTILMSYRTMCVCVALKNVALGVYRVPFLGHLHFHSAKVQIIFEKTKFFPKFFLIVLFRCFCDVVTL